MSRLYGDLTGQARTTTTRRGSAASGISTHVRGWNLGIRVHGGVNNDADTFNVVISSGSNEGRASVPLAYVTEDGDGFVRVELTPKFGGAVLYVDRDGDAYYDKP